MTGNLQVESQLFEILGSNPRIIRSKGLTDDGLRLEYAVNGDLNDYITANPGTSLNQRLRWCRQAAEAVEYSTRSEPSTATPTCAISYSTKISISSSQTSRGCINRVMGAFHLMACLESVPSRSYRESMAITPMWKRTFSLSDARFTSL